MIEFLNVSKHYSKNTEEKETTHVLKNISLLIDSGEFVCILGPSGCGKTTMLNLVAGFALPSQGTVRFNGKTVKKPGPERAVVFQDPTLFPWLTVLENVSFGLRLKGLEEQACRNRAMHYLELTGIVDSADSFPFALSGGMRQRVSLARVLALDPGVLLMDEPFSALDPNTRECLQHEMLRLWDTRQRTVMYVTHSVSEAAYLADRIIILDGYGSISTDTRVSLERPRSRGSAELSVLKEELRNQLRKLPCCAQYRDQYKRTSP